MIAPVNSQEFQGVNVVLRELVLVYFPEVDVKIRFQKG